VFDLDIGIKYCGGCNPRFNRLEFVSQLKRNAPHHNYSLYMGKPSDVYLVVCGCKRACADFSKEKASSFIVIDEDSSVDSVVEVIGLLSK